MAKGAAPDLDVRPLARGKRPSGYVRLEDIPPPNTRLSPTADHPFGKPEKASRSTRIELLRSLGFGLLLLIAAAVGAAMLAATLYDLL